jgi:hypothetical protein
VTTQNGFPGSFPSKLELVNEKLKVRQLDVTPSRTETLATDSSPRNTSAKSHTQWTARTIRPICRMYMNFPYDRDLPLHVSGVDGDTYTKVIRKLPSGDITPYPEKAIFTAPLSWAPPEDIDGKTLVKLACGFWANKKLVTPYRLIIDATDWGTSKKNYILTELEVARKEAMERDKAGKKSEKSWVFFLGKQDLTKPTDFIVTDHRLICCITGEL